MSRHRIFTSDDPSIFPARDALRAYRDHWPLLLVLAMSWRHRNPGGSWRAFTRYLASGGT